MQTCCVCKKPTDNYITVTVADPSLPKKRQTLFSAAVFVCEEHKSEVAGKVRQPALDLA